MYGRRRVLRELAALGVTAAVLPLAPRPVLAAPNLTVFTWADYNNADFHPGFVAAQGASPEFTIFSEEEEALQKLRAGFTPDVAHPCTSSVRRWKDAGVLKPIDTAKLTHWNDVFPAIKRLKGVIIDGAAYHMPWDWGNESILYRSDLVEIKDNSLALLLDERYKGRMAMFNSVDSMTAVAAKLIGLDDWYELDDREIAEIRKVWQRLHANMRFYWDDSTQLEQGLASGELVASWSWNESVWNLRSEGLAVEYMQPKEGRFTWVCGLALIAGGKGDAEQAYQYLDAMLAPDSGKALIEAFGYGHANARSFDLVDAAMVSERGLDNVGEMIATTNFYDEIEPTTREKLIVAFDEVKAGI